MTVEDMTNHVKVSNGAKIRNRYNQVPHLTQDTNGKVTNPILLNSAKQALQQKEHMKRSAKKKKK